MRIAIFGPGAIGSTFAYFLAKGGHDVTVVARGARLAQLQKDLAIVRDTGDKAEVTVATSLDAMVEWDLVLVTVLATQVAAVLPALRASRARKVMFMFNTFDSIGPLSEAVGPERFAFGFPAGVFTLITNGRIHPQVRAGTTVSDKQWADLFSAAGIPSVPDGDMQSWLRSHAAMVVPLMSIGTMVFARGAGASWHEASLAAAALNAGGSIVRAAGNTLRPASIAMLFRLPVFLQTALLWTMSRTKVLRDLGALGTAEPRMLIDMMSAARPDLAGPLRSIRP